MKELVEDLKIANDNLYCANKMLEEEIERLKEVIQKNDKEIDNLCKNQKKEIERLNNIINELKKYIEDTKQDGYKLVWINEYKNYFEAGIEEILGSDKE